jgi:hypothetical protein
MNTIEVERGANAPPPERTAPDPRHRRTLESIFRQPSVQILQWADVVALIENIGVVDRKANSELRFSVGGKRCLVRRPRDKNLTDSDVLELRVFLTIAGGGRSHGLAPAPRFFAGTAALGVAAMGQRSARANLSPGTTA